MAGADEFMPAIVRAPLNFWRRDTIIVVGVTVITVLTDLAIDALAGVVFAALFSPKDDPQHVVIEFCNAQASIDLI